MSYLLNQDYINHLFEAGIIKEKEKSTHTQRIRNYQIMVENYYKELKKKQKQKIENDKNINESNNINLQNKKSNDKVNKSDENDIVSNVLSQ